MSYQYLMNYSTFDAIRFIPYQKFKNLNARACMARVVIIGAGLTGLSVAYNLEQQGFFDYAIFEQESTVGGLCRSIRCDGFTFDYTGHFFHSPSAQMIDFLHTIMQNSSLSAHIRHSYIYSHDTYTPYPYQTNLYGLPTETIIDCIMGFIQRQTHKKNGNFYTWIHTHFGLGFARHFFFPYQEKIFDYPVSKLRTGWVQGVPHTTLEAILKGALQERVVDSIGYNAQFWYPTHGGIDHLIHAFGHALKNPLYTNCSAVVLDTHKKIVTFSNGHSEPYEYLISTIPLNTCLDILGMKKEADKLLVNSVLNINIGIDCDIVGQKHWVYYPEKKHPFFRIGFPSHLRGMAPEGYSSLSIEIATLKKPTPEIIGKLTKKTYEHLEKIFGIQTQDIVSEQTLVLPHAYVIYNLWREKHIDSLLRYLENQSIYSIGRYGGWKYASMHDAITDGHSMAQKLIAHFSATFKPATTVKQNPAHIPAITKKPGRRLIKEIS